MKRVRPPGLSKRESGEKTMKPEEQKDGNRDTPVQGIVAIMEADIVVLRSIKDAEFRWLELYTILAGPAVALLAVRGSKTDIDKNLLVGMLIGYLLATGWVQYVLWKERQSYYRFLRAVVRTQNLLGLFKISFVSNHFAHAAFPRGLGPLQLRGSNGTAPRSSFLQRHIYVLFIYVGLVLAITYNGLPLP